MFLELHVTFTAGHFHGEEWPPSPARLFQALISATHRGAHGLLNADVRDGALLWLESLSAPEIIAVETEPQLDHLINFVPNNDDGDRDDFRVHIRAAKSLRIHPLPADCCVTYRWEFPRADEAEQHADVVTAMASLITYLGRTIDHVYARGEVRESAPEGNGDGRELLLPREVEGGEWLSPRAGFLELCHDRYPRSVSEMPPDFTNSRQIDYSSTAALPDEVPRAVFELYRLDGVKLSRDPRRLREVSGMVRHTFQQWLDANPRMVAHYGDDRIARLLFGHRDSRSAEPSEGGHIAIVSLPSMNVGFDADGWLRRVVILGYGLRDEEDRALFHDLTRGLDSLELRDREQPVGVIRLASSKAQTAALRPWIGLGGVSAQAWRSITPVILTGHPRQGRSLEKCLLRTLAQQGISLENVESVATFTGPTVPKSVAAREYRVRDYLSTTRRVHVEIIFREAVRGPLVLGRGRFVGFGLMFPWT